MAKLKYINSNNKSIELGNAAPFLVTNVDGLGSPQNEIYTQKSPYQDGVTATHSSLGPRNIVIEGKIIDSNRENRQIYRNSLLSALNPKLDGKLVIDLGNVKRQIDCRVEQAPYFPSNSEQNYQDFLINLFAPNPLWQDTYELGEEISTWIGGLQFPFSLPFTLKQRGETRQNIYNSGDVETPVEIIFKGPALNPKIMNHTTGEFIRIKRELTSDDALYITTHFGNKRVETERNGERENAFHYIDLDSTFFELQVGDNLIEYTTESELISRGVEIRYYNRYLGV